MTNQSSIVTEHVSFKDYLLRNRRNKIILFIAGAAIIIQFALFKYLYPFANYIHGDSFSYLNAAEKNLDINTYLIGYSKFLRLFSVFNRTDYVLTAFQYLFIQCSALFLLFTIFYFYKPGKVVQLILLCFMVFNPLFLHLANLISSDGFFLALSLTWFTLLLWIIHHPSLKIIIFHAIILFIAFTVRYNAMIYPLIAIIAFFLSKTTLRQKIMGTAIVAVLCGTFVGFTMHKYHRLTGYWQYSPFSGWQLTNNAMYAYRYVDKADRKPVPKRFQILDKMIREYFDSTRNTIRFPVETMQASTFYMWSPGMPMVKYRERIFQKDIAAKEMKKWAAMGPFYKDYGLYIIKHYPGFFSRYFIWPNANKYYAPPIEFLQFYNSGKSHVTKQTVRWFGYKHEQVKTRTSDNKVWVLDFYPILSGIINVVMLFGLISYWLLKGWRQSTILRYGIFMGSIVWLLNAVFTIWASSAALRFQAFPIILTSTFAILLLGWLWNMAMVIDFQKMKKSDTQRDIPVEVFPQASAR